MTRLLHTSDWHLGHELSSYNRIEEHKDFLRQLADIVGEHRPDVMVVSGDIFHTATPSNAVVAMFAEQIDAIRRRAPRMKIVITAGNHDSGARIESMRTPWSHLGVEMIGRAGRESDGTVNLARHIIKVTPDDSCAGCIVVALPHIFDRNYPALDNTPGDSAAQKQRFMGELSRLIAEASEQMPQAPVVVMAHFATTGCDTTGHDLIGGMEYTDLDNFTLPYDYLALGHIHRRQTFTSADGATARYCGTPLAVSFDEVGSHSVTIVDIDSRGASPRISEVEIEPLWPLVTLGSPDPLSFDEALKAIAAYEGKAYLRARVSIEDVAPAAAAEQAATAMRGREARFCKFQWIRQKSNRDAMDAAAEEVLPDIDSFRSLDPMEVARRYYAATFDGNEMPSELASRLKEICDLAAQPDTAEG